MTLPDFTQILTTVAVGAGATLLTLKVSMAKVEQQLADSSDRIAKSDERIAEVMNMIRREAEELRKAISELTRTVDRQSVYVDGLDEFDSRLRKVETEVAILKERNHK